MEYKLYTLANGIKVAHKEVANTKIVHCGFILDIGSRDEDPHQEGLTHFWEHMAFKGTKKRKAYHILNKLDAVGGELNAYTTKEKITFYASVLDKHIENAVELLTDITFNATFPQHQLERERNVILEEMAMYKDSPEDAIQDEFDARLFLDHPLGHNILGTQENIKGFKQNDFNQFIQEHIDTNKIIFSCVGNVSHKKLIRLVTKHLHNIPEIHNSKPRNPFKTYKPSSHTDYRSITQAHCTFGGTTYSLNHDKRLIFFFLNNILGGPGLNSRLNLSIREKHGLAYGIDSIYSPYTDIGVFGIFFATEKKHLERSINLVKKELNRLKEAPLGQVQLHKAKEQLKGQLAIAEENNLNFMLMMGKSLIDQNKVDSLESIFNKIDKITAHDLQEVAQEIYQEDNFTYLTYQPK